MKSDPERPDYWETLAERVTAGALRHARPGTLDWLAESNIARTLAVVVASAAAIAVAMALRTSDATPWQASLGPNDTLDTAVLLRDEPPQIGALLLGPRKDAPK